MIQWSLHIIFPNHLKTFEIFYPVFLYLLYLPFRLQEDPHIIAVLWI